MVQKKCAFNLHTGAFTHIHFSLLWILKTFFLCWVGQMLKVESIYHSVGTTLLEIEVIYQQRFRTVTFPEGFREWGSTLTRGTFSCCPTAYYYTIQERILYHNIFSLMAEHDTCLFKTWQVQSHCTKYPMTPHINLGFIHRGLISFFVWFLLNINSSNLIS